MSPTMRTSSKPPPSGSTSGGTPERSHPLLTHSDLKSSLATDSGPVKMINDACKWLESKGWILTGDPYDCTRFVTILATAALASNTLEGVTSLLDALASKLTSPPTTAPPGPTWASIAKAALVTTAPPHPPQTKSNSLLSPQELASMQQRLLCDKRTVLICFDPCDKCTPKDFTATRSSKLRDDLNKLLDRLDLKATSLCQEDSELDFVMLTTRAIGLRNVNGSAYVAEFDTTDSA
ncbi:hypothetical protein C0993_000820, partial [Termitomyces sp. T159_Od127]